MRHSSWTLFLVPLALPLVLICFPVALKSLDSVDPAQGVQTELVQQPASLEAPAVTYSGGGSDDGMNQRSDALYRN